jgi:transposase-like protein
MTMLRKVHDEREARAMLAEVRAAGGDVGAWARAHGVDGRSLHAWSRNLARRGRTTRSRRRDPDPELRLVEIVAAHQSQSGGRYVLRIAHAEVEFGDDFREETLHRVLAVLRSC